MYLLIGAGVSNKSIANFLDKRKIEYIIYDDYFMPNKDLIEIEKIELVIKSPGIVMDHWLVKKAKEHGIKVITDIEFMTYFKKCNNIITVTGTLGKTTTSNLINNIIKLDRNVDMIGNMGIPIFDYIDSTYDCIIEASSFMLELVNKFKSNYIVLLNFSLAHLEHHYNYIDYVRAKMKLVKNVDYNDVIVYNHDDILIRRLVENLDCVKIPFSITKEVNGAYIKDNAVYCFNNRIIEVNEILLIGKHNLENILAATAVTYMYKIDPHLIRLAISEFKGIEHRIEFFGKLYSKPIYNDSKATNYKAMKTAIASFTDKKLLLICGGRKRRDEIHILDNYLSNIKYVFAVGENKDEMADFFSSKDIIVIKFDNYLEAANNIKNYLDNVDIILFSPGASSYDAFKNFEERGKVFKQIISTIDGFTKNGS